MAGYPSHHSLARPKVLLWTDQAKASGIAELAAFAMKLIQDMEAVVAAMVMPYSQGQTEGRVNNLKLFKRQLYGRGTGGVRSICSGNACCTLQQLEYSLFHQALACT